MRSTWIVVAVIVAAGAIAWINLGSDDDATETADSSGSALTSPAKAPPGGVSG